MALHQFETETELAAEQLLRSASPLRRSGRIEQLQAQIDQLRAQLRFAVIYSGDKSADGTVIYPTFNPRSWKSYEAVAQDIADALSRIGFCNVVVVPEDMHLAKRLQRERIHMAWLNTGGVQGFNSMSHAAAMLEMLGIPYVGHDPLAAGILDNKHAFKRDLQHLGIPTAPFMTWHLARGPFRPKVNSHFIRTFKDHWGPFVVKPICGRASLHVHFVEEEADLPDAVAQVYGATDNHVLIEAYLPGREFCVAVNGLVVAHDGKLSRRKEPFVFAAVERLLEPNERIFTSMDVRPISANRVWSLDPVADANEVAQLHEIGREIYLEMSLEALIRLDVRADAVGKLHVLEANPKPDLKAPTKDVTSLVCAGLSRHGMSYDDLILSLFADRLDHLFSQRRGSVTHLTSLLE